MKIGKLVIGPDRPCRIVAELGTLHLHNYESLAQATKDALAAGADLVKVQMINAETAWWATSQQITRYKALQWKPTQFAKYFREFRGQAFASVFCESFLTDGVIKASPAFKLASSARRMPFLSKSVLETGKPVLVSLRNEPVTPLPKTALPLYVLPYYPIDVYKEGLPKVGQFFRGFSLHTKDLSYLTAAMVLGAEVLEVHVMGKNAEGPDTDYALNMDELKVLVSLRSSLQAATATPFRVP
jgi:sialic acid synthase SpsE